MAGDVGIKSMMCSINRLKVMLRNMGEEEDDEAFIWQLEWTRFIEGFYKLLTQSLGAVRWARNIFSKGSRDGNVWFVQDFTLFEKRWGEIKRWRYIGERGGGNVDIRRRSA